MVARRCRIQSAPEFQTLYDQQNFGLPLSQALEEFRRADSVPGRAVLRDGRADAEGGGRKPLGGSRQSRSIIRDRFKVKRQVRVQSAHGRITGWVLSALPTALGLFFAFMNPDKYATFYRIRWGCSHRGALFLQLVGVFIIKKIVNIEY